MASTLNLYRAQSGFSLIELVTVIAVLSVLAFTVVPRFFGSAGFAEYAYQQQFVAAMRNLQLKAIYDTRSDFCYKMILDTSSTPAYGPSSDSYLAGQQSASCGNTIDSASADFLRTQNDEISDADLSLSAQDNGVGITFIQFDNFGRPSTSAGSCSATCRISFTGEETLSVCIEAQGYIYACS